MFSCQYHTCDLCSLWHSSCEANHINAYTNDNFYDINVALNPIVQSACKYLQSLHKASSFYLPIATCDVFCSID